VKVKILKAPPVGLDIRPKGCDVSVNSTVAARGTVLSPPEIGLLCSVGVTRVEVFLQPRIAVLSSGNEVVDPFSVQNGKEAPAPGTIFDSNSPMLASLLRSKGFVNVTRVGVAPDDEEQLFSKLRSVLSTCDVLITTGGVSMGEKDLLKHVLSSKLEANVHFGRVNVKPGKPTTFATVPGSLFSSKIDKLVFALPGNPVSAFVTANLFVLPSLNKVCGRSTEPLRVQAVLDADVALDPVRPEYHRVRLRSEKGGRCVAVSTGSQLSSRLLSVSSADALLVLPAAADGGGTASLKKGAVVEALLL
jgi:gephyrin